MKIKTFQFLLSDESGNSLCDCSHGTFSPKRGPATDADIDAKIDQWAQKSGAMIRDVKIRTYTLQSTKRAWGQSETVVLVYAVLYDLPDSAESLEG